MADNLHVTTEHESPRDWPELARWIVMDQARALGDDSNFQVYVVWFCFILGGWKALCSTTRPDGRYYEVTYNKDKGEAYVDTYKKTHNIAVTIEE
jgi:hypothetical protein